MTTSPEPKYEACDDLVMYRGQRVRILGRWYSPDNGSWLYEVKIMENDQIFCNVPESSLEEPAGCPAGHVAPRTAGGTCAACEQPKIHGESRFVRRSDTVDADPRKALQRAWHAFLRDTDNATDHAAIQRAARATDRAGCERETTDWYAAAINHYLSR